MARASRAARAALLGAEASAGGHRPPYCEYPIHQIVTQLRRLLVAAYSDDGRGTKARAGSQLDRDAKCDRRSPRARARARVGAVFEPIRE